MRTYGQKYLQDGTLIQIKESMFGRWRIDTLSFPAMRIIKSQRFGWDEDAACVAYDRLVAVSEAIRALQGTRVPLAACNLVYMPAQMQYFCETCHETLDSYEVDQLRQSNYCRA